MTQEEKARAYDKALKRAKQMFSEKELNYLFHELKESEDERIMKELIDFIYDKTDTYELREKSNSWLAWIEKQGEQKEYTFKALPRLLDMIEPTERAKAYCQKLIDSLVKEGYFTDAKIVGECLKKMNGENVPMAIMDEKQGEQNSDTYKQGYKDAVDKVCELIFEYNKRQARKFSAKSMMRLPDYTINVGDFRKIMEEQQ